LRCKLAFENLPTFSVSSRSHVAWYFCPLDSRMMVTTASNLPVKPSPHRRRSHRSPHSLSLQPSSASTKEKQKRKNPPPRRSGARLCGAPRLPVRHLGCLLATHVVAPTASSHVPAHTEVGDAAAPPFQLGLPAAHSASPTTVRSTPPSC